MTTPDVNTVLLDFHGRCGREMVVENEDGSYTIFINARLSYASQLEAYQHAIGHIQNNDFEKSDVQSIETLAHQLPHHSEAKPVPTTCYEKKLRSIRRRKKRFQRQFAELEKHLDMLDIIDPDGRFRRAEQNWLYGFL